jgi:hypothetical protein
MDKKYNDKWALAKKLNMSYTKVFLQYICSTKNCEHLVLSKNMKIFITNNFETILAEANFKTHNKSTT